MKKFNHLVHFSAAATIVSLIILLSCTTRVNEKELNTNTSNSSTNLGNIKSIPDSVIQFLITSAATDFNEHQPPTVIDIRNVKAGYISSGNELTYLICGEFLSQEKQNWESFVTIKTSGYEQYIGKNEYCQKATFEKADNNILSNEIKRILNELKK